MTANYVDKNSLVRAAKDCISHGFSVLATKKNKQPVVGREIDFSWKILQTRLTKPEEIQSLIRKPETVGIGIVAGKVSGNVEVIDLDLKYDLTGTLWDDIKKLFAEHAPELLKKLVIAKTKNDGFHLIFKHTGATVLGNRTLASRPTTDEEKAAEKKLKGSCTAVKVLAETRGEGGYIVCAPSPGYKFVQGDLSNVPTLTDAERNIIYSIMASFDQTPAEADYKQKQASRDYADNGLTPFDDYNERADTVGLLLKHGWSVVSDRANIVQLKRPGHSDSKLSASLFKDRKVLYVFSTSTQFQAEKGYSSAAIYTTLEHNGDFSAAAKALYADGYGSRYNPHSENEDKKTEDEAAITFKTLRPLDATLKPVEEIDDDFLPEVLVNWLRPASKVIGCPFDFLVLSAVVMIGSIIGSRIRVKPLRHSDWFVVPSLYGGLVGLPSTKKSPALDETRKPIVELQSAARTEFSEKKADYEITARFYEKESQKGLKAAESAEAYKTALSLLEKPEKPALRRFEVNDITIPKLVQFLNENSNGLLQSRDELMGWLKSLEADYNANGRPFILELWKGALDYDLARQAEDREVYVKSGTLSIMGGIQPSKLQKYVVEAYSFDESDGFLQRFLFAYPNAAPRRNQPSASDQNAMRQGFAKANQLIKHLADFDFHGKVCGANGDVFHVVKFSEAAQQLVDQWREEIEVEAESCQVEDEAFSSFLYKLGKNCFAIALIFHCLESVYETNFPDEISESTTLKAINYTQVLLSHARRVFALGENQIFSLAQIALGKIKKGEIHSGFTVREFARKQWSGLRAKDTVQDVLAVLVEYGYIAEQKSSGDGRPTTRYFIHPSLIQEEQND